MRVYSGRHARLEIDYLHQFGRLEDQMRYAKAEDFKDAGAVDTWKQGLQEEAPAVFEPLSDYFQGRATRQKIGMVATLVPVGLAAFDILRNGVNANNATLGLVGVGLNFMFQVKHRQAQEDLAGVIFAQADFHRDTEYAARYLKTEMAQAERQAREAEIKALVTPPDVIALPAPETPLLLTGP